jgi:hypothetical protein
MPSVSDLSNDAGFIFQANVEQLGASTARGFTASGETAVVLITKIVKSPAALAGYQGHRITVELQPPVSLQAGQSAVFFTHGVHYGESVVVRELGNTPPQAATEAQVSSAMQDDRDSALTQRMAQADLVLTGVASAPAQYIETTSSLVGRYVSEHDPQWWQSVITIDSVEKGSHVGGTKSILFPHSTDIAWYSSPKVKEGDRGVWLLHLRDLRGRATPYHALIHPLDFQPLDQVERIRSLMKK